MSIINLLHTIPEFRELDYQMRSYGFDLSEVLANLDFQKVSIAALLVGLAVLAYSYFAKGGPAGLLSYGKSLDNSLDGGKAWHDTRKFGFRSISDNSTDSKHTEVMDALSDIVSKWGSDDVTEDEVITEAPALDS